MTNIKNNKQTFDVLDRTLETFGADQRRWPEQVRAQLVALVTVSGEARQRVAAAKALDRVLDFAPRLSDERLAELAERIATQVPRQPRLAGTSYGVRGRAVSRAKGLIGNWPLHSLSAAALAASLVLGVIAGQNATVESLTNVMVNGVDAGSSQQFAQGDDGDSLFDEELL